MNVAETIQRYQRFPADHPKHSGRIRQRIVKCKCGREFWQMAFAAEYLASISDELRDSILADSQVEEDGTVWHLRAHDRLSANQLFCAGRLFG